MLYHNVRVLAHAGSAVDAAVVCLGALAGRALCASAGLAPKAPDLQPLGVLALAFALAFVIIGGRMRLYHPWRTETLLSELVALSEAALCAMGLAILVASVLGLSRGGPELASMVLGGWLTLMLLRICMRWVIRRWRRRGDDYRVWLMVGRNARSTALLNEIESNPQYGIRIAAILDVGATGVDGERTAIAPGKVPVHTLPDAEALREILATQVIDEVVITLPVRSCYDLIQSMLRICSAAGISVKLLPEAFAMPESSRHLAAIGPIPVLTHYSGTGHYGQLLLKRFIDMAGSLLGLMLALPLLVPVAVWAKRSSPGPLFFKQTRVGLHGRHFNMIKIRTMYVDAEQRRCELAQLNERDGTAFKLRNDPRITPAGRWLRKFHIDELPQLWNVLVGDMSLVGPRPLPVKEANGNEWWQRRRLTVPPGLTCLWQLQDDPVIPFQQWMRMDMDYIDRWSVWLDLKIIVLTFGTLVRGRGW
jgi:exopolysaccharide biosynthesis polyprenyl glycosylphosphotransferase